MSTKEAEAFAALGLQPWLIKQLHKLGLKSPTPIQINCIPEILNGKDCVGAAKTGSGKTFAFALPIIQKLSEEPVNHFALILTPTHELAYQISEQFQVAGQQMGLRVCVVAGGTDQMIESQKLMSRPHIVVAMPGRLADHLTGCDTFSFDTLKFLVVDEADRMLNGDFDESLAVIEKCLPQKRQNLYFSATLKDFIKESSIFPISPEVFEWCEDDPVATVETLKQFYILCANYDRDMVLIEALREYRLSHATDSVMIFTSTKKQCQLLSMTLTTIGYENVCLHGFMRQRERVQALNRFKSKQINTLIATDVAARGLDIPSVELVMNHRLPRTPKEYIHRVGRTARAGRNGLALSIFRFPHDLQLLEEIESTINVELTEHKIDQRMVDSIFLEVDTSRRENEITLDNKDFDDRAQNYRRKNWIIKGLDPDEMEADYKKKQKQKLREIRREREERRKQNASEEQPSALINDERFKNMETKRFVKKTKTEPKPPETSRRLKKSKVVILDKKSKLVKKIKQKKQENIKRKKIDKKVIKKKKKL